MTEAKDCATTQQDAIDDLMERASALLDQHWQVRLQQLKIVLRGCGWTTQQIDTYLLEASTAYVGWREVTLREIEQEVFGTSPSVAPESETRWLQ